MDVELRPISRDQLPVLQRLYQLYRYDLSECSGQDIGPDGHYPHVELESYVSEPNFGSYFIFVDGSIAGLILVNLQSHTHGDETVKNLDDLFILRKYRGQGVGTRAAGKLFEERPGWWQTNKKTYNGPAMQFWGRVIGDLTGGDFTEHVAKGDIHIHLFKVGRQP